MVAKSHPLPCQNLQMLYNTAAFTHLFLNTVLFLPIHKAHIAANHITFQLSLSTDNNPEKLTLELKHLFFEIILPIETQIPYTFAALICHRMMLYIYN